MKLPNLKPQLGDIVVDTDFTLFAIMDFEFFKRRSPKLIEPLHVLALFALAEAIVLHERVLSEHVDEKDVSCSSTIAQLVKAGVLGRIDHVMDYNQNKPDKFQTRVWKKLEPLAVDLATWTGADFTLSASAARARWCDEQNIDHLPWPVFGPLPGEAIHRQHVVDQGYAHVKKLMKQRVVELRGAGAAIPLYVPPIPALVLQRCGGRADRFFSETLALRAEFATARRKLSAYQGLIGNVEGRTLGELSQSYRDAVSDVIAALDHVAKKRTDSCLLLELWDTVCEVKAKGGDGGVTFETGLSFSALLSKGLKWLEVRRIQARARLLFDLYEKALQIRNYGTLVTKVFKTDPRKLVMAAEAFETLGRNIDHIISVNRVGSLKSIHEKS